MRRSWLLVLACGSLIIACSMGVRQVSGLFLRPVAMDLALSRETFGFAVALQNLVWGLTQPIAGLLADRYGTRPVALGGVLLYAAGLALAALASSGWQFVFGLGILAGLGQSGTAFAVILAVIGRAAPADARSLALGFGSTASSIGMFVVVPMTAGLLDIVDWRTAMFVLGGLIAATAVFTLPLEEGVGSGASAPAASARRASVEATSDRDFWLLNLGFAVCGFQLAFIATYIPTIVIDGGLSMTTGAAVLAAIGIFNIVGTSLAGFAGGWWPKTRVLAGIYLARAIVIVVFLSVPLSTTSAIVFGTAIGLLWTGTVPLTNGLVAYLWGRCNLAFLFGLVYVGHQIGAFAGAWAGGLSFDRTGSFAPVWAVMVLASLAAAACHLLVHEKPRSLALAEAPG